MFTIKVEYYRALEYSVKWKDPMNPVRRSKRLEKSPNDSCVEDSIHRKTRGRRRQNGWGEKAQPENRKAEMDKLSADDILDIIDRSHESDSEERATVEVADEGVDLSDDDTNSVRSGPSFPRKLPAEKPVSSLCPACRKLYQRVKWMKAPLKDKLLDNNPKSPTCDQWILLKLWRSKALPDSRGNFSQVIHQIIQKGKKKDKLAVEVCSRPHLFLTRNLRRCIRKPQKKEKKTKNWRKRSREDSRGPRVAKQQRLLNNQRQPSSCNLSHNNSVQPVRNGVSHTSPDPTSGHSSTFLESAEDSDLTLRPGSVTLETDSSKVNPKQSVSKRGAGFKDLLAQLRGNHSMIIRESTTEVTPKNHPPFTG